MGKFRLNPENRKSSKETPLIGRKNVRKISLKSKISQENKSLC